MPVTFDNNTSSVISDEIKESNLSDRIDIEELDQYLAKRIEELAGNSVYINKLTYAVNCAKEVLKETGNSVATDTVELSSDILSKINKYFNELSEEDKNNLYQTGIISNNVNKLKEFINKSKISSFDTYTVKDLEDRINQNTTDNLQTEILKGDVYLKQTCASQIDKMVKGASLLRIGDIWYGEDSDCTVTGISYMGDKKVNMVQPLRTDLALSFSNSNPPIDTLQIEIVVHISKFSSHVQRLAAISEITPSIPILNPAIAAMVQPIQQNKSIYEAYGHKISKISKDTSNYNDILYALSSTPIHVHIDRMNISYAGPRDIRLLVQVTRVITSNSYGDRVLYCRGINDALRQHVYLKSVNSSGKDTDQIKAFSTMFNLYSSEIDTMINELQRVPKNIGDNFAPFEMKVTDVEDGDTYIGHKVGNTVDKTTYTIRVWGCDTPETEAFARDTQSRASNIPPQPYSHEAKIEAKKMIESVNNIVIIKPTAKETIDRGRVIGEVFLKDNKNTCVGLELVRKGLAHFYIQADSNEAAERASIYRNAQEDAIKQKINIWSQKPEDIELPSEYRKRWNKTKEKVI
jgi:endonuclease YncB( thermonuclease family)